MNNRAWKACTRTAAAIAVSVLALTTGAAAASAAPPGSSPSSGIKVTHGRFDLVVPVGRARPAAPAGEITAFHGFSSFQTFVLQSHGVDLDGTIEGDLWTYNYKALWQVYNLPSSDSWKVWGFRFSHDSNRSVLKNTYLNQEQHHFHVSAHFTIKAADMQGVSSLRIGFETLRLQLDGTTKDFTVVNSSSGGAKDDKDHDIPIHFDPIS
ncbi:hypothetical protein [Amycolatopsis sp. WGS_07]|uniref:hypothetical protein n=1 Tax=Amycolatopsis sp. WGS_07 TaxID=3076764 RepID=UPI003872AEF6